LEEKTRLKDGDDDNLPSVSEEKRVAEKNVELKEEDEIRGKEEKRKKARLRTRGPYRKAHANWQE
jgi:hypothetical protein